MDVLAWMCWQECVGMDVLARMYGCAACAIMPRLFFARAFVWRLAQSVSVFLQVQQAVREGQLRQHGFECRSDWVRPSELASLQTAARPSAAMNDADEYDGAALANAESAAATAAEAEQFGQQLAQLRRELEQARSETQVEILRLRENREEVQTTQPEMKNTASDNLRVMQQEMEALRSEQSRLQRAVEGATQDVSEIETSLTTVQEEVAAMHERLGEGGQSGAEALAGGMAEGEEGAGRGSGSVPREDVAAVQEDLEQVFKRVAVLQQTAEKADSFINQLESSLPSALESIRLDQVEAAAGLQHEISKLQKDIAACQAAVESVSSDGSRLSSTGGGTKVGGAGGGAVKKLDPSDFMFCKRKGEKLVKKPGEIGGQQFILEDLEDCEVLLLDHCAQVSCPRSILLRR